MQAGGKPPNRLMASETFESGTNALYVGDLDKTINEAALYQVFSKIGPIQSIRVCRDSVTRRSLGYAYVNFINSIDNQTASKAMELLNYTPMKGRPIRIMRAQRDPTSRNSGIGNIFVKGLDSEIDSRTLHDTFEVFGPIKSAKVALNDDLSPLGYGYVQYNSAEGAQAAVERANGMLLKGRQLYVAPYLSKRERESTRGFTNIYCNNLPESVVDENSLKELFAKFGTITSVFLARDHMGMMKGFAFVNFEDGAMAQTAINDMNNTEVSEGKLMYVGPAQKKTARQRLLKDRFEKIKREHQQSTQGRNLFIKQFNLEYTTSDLEKLFEKFGKITSAKIVTDDTGRSRGFGFVCFEKNDNANEAIKEMHGKHIDGKKLYVALHQNKEARQAELSRQRLGMNYGMGMGMAPPYPSPMMPPNMMPPTNMWPMMGGGGNQPPMYPDSRRVPKSRGGRRPGRGGANRDFQQGYGYGQQQPMGGYGPSPFIFNMATPPQQQPQQPMAQVMPQPSPPTQASNVIDSTTGPSASSPRREKVFLGEKLYPAVHNLQPGKAAKITGMLLEMELNEIQLLLQDPNVLASRVKEAVQVLEEHGVQDDEEKY